MSRSRVITGAILVAGSVFASGLFAGDAAAQYEPVGKPLQLLPPSYTGKSAATPRSRVAAKKAAKTGAQSENKSETKSAAKSETKSETKARPKAAKVRNMAIFLVCDGSVDFSPHENESRGD